jgi:hypothetical protein
MFNQISHKIQSQCDVLLIKRIFNLKMYLIVGALIFTNACDFGGGVNITNACGEDGTTRCNEFEPAECRDVECSAKEVCVLGGNARDTHHLVLLLTL